MLALPREDRPTYNRRRARHIRRIRWEVIVRLPRPRATCNQGTIAEWAVTPAVFCQLECIDCHDKHSGEVADVFALDIHVQIAEFRDTTLIH